MIKKPPLLFGFYFFVLLSHQSIWPNPSRELINLGNLVSGSRIRLLDMLSNCLLDNMTENTNYCIDLQKFANGMFFAEISKGDKNNVARIVLNR